MKTTSYSIVILLFIFGCDYADKKYVMSEIDHKNEASQKSEDSSWTYNEFKNAELSIDIWINGKRRNFDIKSIN